MKFWPLVFTLAIGMGLGMQAMVWKYGATPWEISQQREQDKNAAFLLAVQHLHDQTIPKITERLRAIEDKIWVRCNVLEKEADDTQGTSLPQHPLPLVINNAACIHCNEDLTVCQPCDPSPRKWLKNHDTMIDGKGARP